MAFRDENPTFGVVRFEPTQQPDTRGILDGSMWYDTTAKQFKGVVNGAIVAVGSGGGGAISSVFGRTGTVVSATNDYNFNQLAGTAAKAQIPATAVYTDQVNTFGAFLQDFTAASFKVPNSAGASPTTNGLIAYDTTANRYSVGLSAANVIFPWFSSGIPVNAQCVTWNGTSGQQGSVACSSGFTNPMTTLGDTIFENATPAAARLAGPTLPNGVPQVLTSTPSAGAATAPVWSLTGVTPNPQTGTTYTVAATDRSSYITFNNAGAIAVTLPQAGSSGFASNFVFVACDIGAGTATITPTTSTISYSNGSAYTSAAATLPLTTGQCAWIYSDNTNYFAILRSGGAGGSPSLNSVTSLTASNTPLANGNFTETMGWQLTGSGVEDGLLLNETAASTNSGVGSTLARVKTSSGSTIIPLVVETANNFGTPFIFQVKMNSTGVFGIDGNGAVQLSAAANNGLVSCNSGAGQFCRLSTGNAVDWTFFTNGVFAMGIPSGTGAQGSYIQIPNNGATATVVNKLAILTGAPSTATLALTTSTTGVVGLVISGAGTTGNANILSHRGDMGNCVFDATAITAGDYVVASTTTGGACHDAGSTRPATLQIIGRAMASAAASSTVQIKLILDGE